MIVRVAWIIAVTALAAAAPARADDAVPPMSFPADAGLPLDQIGRADVPDVARELFHDLACTCGECKHLSLASCPCGFAGEARQEILTMLQGRDLSTPEKQRAARGEVRDAFVARHGEDALAGSTGHPIAYDMLVVYLVTSAGVLVLGVLSWRWHRRPKRGAGPRRAGPPASRKKRK